MREVSYLIIGKNGVRGVRKTKPSLGWDEIACKINLNVPDELFKRPHIEATLKIEDIPNNAYNPDIVINTKELIEQQTGVKVNFKIIPYDESEDKNE